MKTLLLLCSLLASSQSFAETPADPNAINIARLKEIVSINSGSANIKGVTAVQEKIKPWFEALGFKVFAGDLKMNYLIMKNENSLIGLFQGMFEKNILTFN